MDKKYITWEEIEYLIWRISVKLEDIPFNSIYGIPRGGVVPGVMLSHRTGKPWTGTLRTGSLVIDDIADSGETFLNLSKEAGRNLITVGLYKRESSRFTPTVYGKEIPEGVWLVFPWEDKLSRQTRDNTKVL